MPDPPTIRALIEQIIADFSEALTAPRSPHRGVCLSCGVDHDNEARLNRAVLSLTLRQLKRLSLLASAEAQPQLCPATNEGLTPLPHSYRCEYCRQPLAAEAQPPQQSDQG